MDHVGSDEEIRFLLRTVFDHHREAPVTNPLDLHELPHWIVPSLRDARKIYRSCAWSISWPTVRLVVT